MEATHLMDDMFACDKHCLHPRRRWWWWGIFLCESGWKKGEVTHAGPRRVLGGAGFGTMERHVASASAPVPYHSDQRTILQWQLPPV